MNIVVLTICIFISENVSFTTHVVYRNKSFYMKNRFKTSILKTLNFLKKNNQFQAKFIWQKYFMLPLELNILYRAIKPLVVLPSCSTRGHKLIKSTKKYNKLYTAVACNRWTGNFVIFSKTSRRNGVHFIFEENNLLRKLFLLLLFYLTLINLT